MKFVKGTYWASYLPKKGDEKMIMKLWNFLQGKKSYITACIMILYALSSVYLGKMDWQSAVMYLFGGSALISIKSAINKVG